MLFCRQLYFSLLCSVLSQCLNLHWLINSKGAPTNLNSCPWPPAAQQGLKVPFFVEESLDQDDNLLLSRLFAWVPALSGVGGSHLRLVLPAWLRAQGGWRALGAASSCSYATCWCPGAVAQLNPQQWLLVLIITHCHSYHWEGAHWSPGTWQVTAAAHSGHRPGDTAWPWLGQGACRCVLLRKQVTLCPAASAPAYLKGS